MCETHLSLGVWSSAAETLQKNSTVWQGVLALDVGDGAGTSGSVESVEGW